MRIDIETVSKRFGEFVGLGVAGAQHHVRHDRLTLDLVGHTAHPRLTAGGIVEDLLACRDVLCDLEIETRPYFRAPQGELGHDDVDVEPAIKKLGGTMERFWLSFGEYDIIGIVQMPDSIAAAAFSLAISAGGACKNVKTTPLLTVQEGVEAMKRAATSGYKAATA